MTNDNIDINSLIRDTNV